MTAHHGMKSQANQLSPNDPTGRKHADPTEQSVGMSMAAPQPGMGVPGWAQTPVAEERQDRLRLACLNVAGLSGDFHRLEAYMDSEGIDLLFLSETWTDEGQARRYSNRVVHALEHSRKSIYGRLSYGQAIMLNPKTTSPEDFVLVEDDQSEDKCYSVVRFRGVTLVCAYIAPSRPLEWLKEKIESFSHHLAAPEDPVILMGDLNARHKAFGDSIINTYGPTLIDEMGELGMERMTPIRGKWTFLNGTKRSIVDHVYVNEVAASCSHSLVVVEENNVGNSDHRLLVFETAAFARPANRPEAVRPWNRLRLKDAEPRQEFAHYCGMLIPPLIDDLMALKASDDLPLEERADRMDLRITAWMEDGLRKVIGRTPPPRAGWASQFLTRELIASEKVVDYHFHEWHSNRGDTVNHRNVRLWATYEAHKRAHAKLVQARKLEMYQEFCLKLDSMQPGEQARTISAMRRNKGRAKGSPLKTDPESMVANGEHFARQFCNSLPEVPLVEDLDAAEPEPFCFEAIFLPECFDKAIKTLAKGKACGGSGIPGEVFQALREWIWEPLQLLFLFCANNGVVPRSWTKARIHPVPKKGDLTKISNYRPISLTEVGRKLFESMLLPHLTSTVEPLSVEQGGFRARRGTMDQIAALQEWISQSIQLKRDRFMAFLDIKAAYDQVDRRLLWLRCRKRGMSSNMIALLQALFDSNQSYVAINGHSSAPFPISSGVLQGSLLSPLLYSVFIDDLITALNARRTPSGTTIGGREYKCLLYADDIVLLANSRPALRALLHIAEEHSLANRYRFSVPKCELVASSDPHLGGQMQIYGQRLPISEVFTYLGCAFSKDGIDWPVHQQRMAARALNGASVLRSAGINGRLIKLSTSMATFRTFIRPVLEYGLAITPKSKLKPLIKAYNRSLSWLASAGRNACISATGLFGGLEPFEARHEKLARRFYLRTLGLKADRERHFAVVDAFKSFQAKRTKGSTFTNLEELPSVKAHITAINSRRWLGDDAPLPPTWEQRLEEIVEDVCVSYKSAYVFGGRDANERKRLLKSFRKLTAQEQRLIYLWCLNRATGPWKTCRHCSAAGASKSHLEQCVHRWAGQPTGPSLIEDRLLEAESLPDLQAIAEDIYQCLGDGPVS